MAPLLFQRLLEAVEAHRSFSARLLEGIDVAGEHALVLVAHSSYGGGARFVGRVRATPNLRAGLLALPHHALPEVVVRGKAVQQLLHSELLGRGAALVPAELPQATLQLRALALGRRRHLAVPGKKALPPPGQFLQPAVQLADEIPVAHACKDTQTDPLPCVRASG